MSLLLHYSILDQDLSSKDPRIDQASREKSMVAVRVYQPSTRLFSAADSPDLDAWIEQSLAEGAKHLIIDFQHVMFMDSQGVGALMKAFKTVKRAGGEFAICSMREQTQMLLDLAGVNSVFSVYDSPDEFKLHLTT